MKPTRPSDLEIDFVERSGFQIGRAVALQDWAAHREDKAFKTFCVRLYQKNWARKRRREQPDRVRGNLNRWRRANGDAVRAKERARRARKRPPIVLTCQHCEKRFKPLRYKHAKWCSRKCSNAYWGKHRKSRNRGIRNMKLEPTVFAILRATPGLTLGEIVERAPEVKRGSLASKLTAWVQGGKVIREDRRYRLATP